MVEPGIADVRSARAADIPRVLALWRAAGAIPSVTDHAGALEGLLAHDPGALLVAEEDGEIVGTVISAWDGWRGALYRLAVDPGRRRRGLARTLVERGVDRLRSLGAARVHVIAAADEASAVALWKAAGFEPRPDHLRLVSTFLGPAGGGGPGGGEGSVPAGDRDC